jgi:alginate production protein
MRLSKLISTFVSAIVAVAVCQHAYADLVADGKVRLVPLAPGPVTIPTAPGLTEFDWLSEPRWDPDQRLPYAVAEADRDTRRARESLTGDSLAQALAGTQSTTPSTEIYRDQEGVNKAPVRLDPGEKRPSDQFQIPIFDRPLTIGGQYELQPQYRKDGKLDPDKADDIASIDQGLKLELFYPISATTTVFLQNTLFYEAEVYAEDKHPEYARGIERQQAWIFMQNVADSPFSLQLGRQRFADKRQWWWNDELDAARIYYNKENFAAEFALGEEAGVKRSDEDFVDPRQDNVFRLLGDGIWQWDEKQFLSVFYLSQFDHSATEAIGDHVNRRKEDRFDADLTWFGARAFGKRRVNDEVKLGYWFDSAWVFGRETVLDYTGIDATRSQVIDRHENDVRGWAVDTGVTWFTNLPYEPYFIAGYARASGDSDPNDGVDNNFRQSSLQGNKVKFGSTQRFRWYGEAFRPELSNMQIWSLGVGLPLSEQSSIDFLYHDYRQVEPSATIRNSRLRTNPDGLHTDLGEEFDLIVSLDEWKHFQFQAVCSVFRAGEAFGKLEGNTTSTIFFNLNYSF